MAIARALTAAVPPPTGMIKSAPAFSTAWAASSTMGAGESVCNPSNIPAKRVPNSFLTLSSNFFSFAIDCPQIIKAFFTSNLSTSARRFPKASFPENILVPKPRYL